jgi:hypothetical protein
MDSGFEFRNLGRFGPDQRPNGSFGQENCGDYLEQ